MSPRNKCFICKKSLKVKEQKIACSECKKIQHITCANISEQQYNLMATNHNKGIWKCNSCKQRTNSISKKDNQNKGHTISPRRLRNKLTNIISNERSNSAFNTPENNTPVNTSDKVTQRNYVLNISTNNSFQSLDSEDFNLGGNTSSEHTDKQNRSYPGVGAITLEDYEKLEKKIQDMTTKLKDTDNYLGKLLIENENMKKEIEKYKTQISYLTNICRTPSGKKGLSSSNNKRDSSVTKRIQLDNKRDNVRQDDEKHNMSPNLENVQSKVLNGSPKMENNQYKDSNIIQDNYLEATHIDLEHKYDENTHTNLKHDKNDFQQTKTKKIVIKPEETIRKPLNKVIIIADEQGKGLQHCIQSLLGEKFAVCCFWKSGAKMLDVLNSYKTEIMSLSKDDYVVVIGGTNDNNPSEFKTAIATWLNFVNTTNIMFCEVPFNKALNEYMLNQVITQQCKQREHCTFINLNYTNRRIPKRDNFIYNISRYIFREILRTQNYCKYQRLILPVCEKSTQTDDVMSPIKGKGSMDFPNASIISLNGNEEFYSSSRNVSINNDPDLFRV